MTSRRFRLPPLPALVAFESAARMLSFKNAAEEMNLTPSAISQHIKLLEGDMGATLFVRKHRGVELTATGELLRQSIVEGLNQLSSSLEGIRCLENNRAVVVQTSTAVSSLWLTPRLCEFWRAHGAVEVNQHVSDSAAEFSPDCELEIWYGQAQESKPEAELLFNDRLVPVCSPNYAATLGPSDRTVKGLSQQTLIYLDANAAWTTWYDWFCLQGYKGTLTTGPHVNNFSIAVQCARDDVGIVLGWERLLRPLLDRGLLVTLDEFAMEAPGRFYISYPAHRPLRDNAALLRDWLIASV